MNIQQTEGDYTYTTASGETRTVRIVETEFGRSCHPATARDIIRDVTARMPDVPHRVIVRPDPRTDHVETHTLLFFPGVLTGFIDGIYYLDGKMLVWGGAGSDHAAFTAVYRMGIGWD